MKIIVLSIVAAATAFAGGGHRPLLPQPQRLSYGAGSLSLKGLSITLSQGAASEDRFAAAALADAFKAAGAIVPVREGPAPAPALLLKRTGPVRAMPERDEQPGPASRESYRIRIAAKGGEVVAPSSAGLFYAVQTLRQMVEGRGAGASLPEAQVEDWPAMAYRGFMMDLSHGSIMKEDEIRRQIDFLARFKANQYYFYSEAAIELKGYPLLNPKARYSQNEIRRIVAYARERHVDIVPCVELYAHLHDVFRVERYAGMAAVEHGRDLNPLDPRAEGMIRDWVAQFSELFPSPWIHVGLDEPFEIDALGGLADGSVSARELYRRQFETVTSLTHAHGKRTLFWADLDGRRGFTKYPIDKLPADVVPVPWYYDARRDYTVFVEGFGKAGKPQVVAPGVTCWNEIFPDYPSTFANINGFIADGRKHGAIGVINTGWTDDAQTIYRPVLPGLAIGAVASWQAGPVDPASFFTDYASQMYSGDLAREMAAALTALSEARESLARAVGRDTMHRLWDDPLEPGALKKTAPHRDDLRRGRLRAEDAMEALMRAAELAPADDTLPSLQLAAGMLDYLGMKRLYALDFADYFRLAAENPTPRKLYLYMHLEGSSQTHGHIADLMDTIASLKSDYEQAWKQEWTLYRLGSALGRWDAEYEFWRAFQGRIERFSDHYEKGGAVPTLESFRQQK